MNAFYKYSFLTAFLTAWLFQPSQAQLYVQNNTANFLVQNILLGTGVTASNIILSKGNPAQIGFFRSNGSNIGLDSGVVMCTGQIQVAVGPNTSGSYTLPGGGYNGPGDPDLNMITNPNITKDAAVLEFDFIPEGDTVNFKYVFASEEYPEYVNTSFNDVFAFFLSGPGITGPYSNNSRNIAIIPGTTIPVAINNVNNGNTNCPSPMPGPCEYCNLYVNNCGGSTIQFDGFTTVLEARAIVQCGKTYHIKLAIADASDAIFDSGVFLEAKSFKGSKIEVSSIPPNVDSTATAGADTALFEGCGPVKLTLVRSGTTSAKQTFYMAYGGSAIPGSDYLPLPDSITFAPGQDSLTIYLWPLNDGFPDPIDDLKITIIGVSCAASASTDIVLTIQDAPAITITSVDTVMDCFTDSILIHAQISGGIPTVTYKWSTGDSGVRNTTGVTSIYVSPGASSEYYITATDGCKLPNTQAVDTIKVHVWTKDDVPEITLSSVNDTMDCFTDSTLLSVTVLSGLSPYTYLWSDSSVSDSTVVGPLSTSDFYVSVTDACGFQVGVDTVSVYVWTIADVPEIFLSNTDDTVLCYNPIGTVNVNVDSGFAPFTYVWGIGNTLWNINYTDTFLVDTPVNSTEYYVKVTDACGFQTKIGKSTVTVLTSQVFLTPTHASTRCPGDTALISDSIVGGYPPYQVWWNNAPPDTTSSQTISQTVNPSTDNWYIVYVTDRCARDTAFDTVKVFVTQYPQLKDTAGTSDTLHCPGDVMAFQPGVTGGSGGYKFSWDGWLTYNDSIVVKPDSTKTYTVLVTDNCGTDTLSGDVTVYVPIIDTLRVITSDTLHTCPGKGVDLVAKVTGGRSAYSYAWNNFAGNTDSTTVVPLQTVVYSVSVTDDCQNKTSKNVVVSVVVPEADFAYEYGPGGMLLFLNQSSEMATKFYWDFGDGGLSSTRHPEYYYKTEGEYNATLIVETDYGCRDTTVKKVTPPFELFIPNVFSPNGDDINDVYEIKGVGIAKFFLTVYDRWGVVIFTSDNVQKQWDGKINGTLAQPGVFVYRIKAAGIKGEKMERTGTFLLLR